MGDKLLKLRQLQTLRTNGTITEEEFNQMKKEILTNTENRSDQVDHVQRLAQKKIWVVILWAISFPIGAYAYTRRWKPFFILLGCMAVCGVVIGAASESEEEGMANSFLFGSFVAPLVTGIDNGVAIAQAREKQNANCDDRLR